MDSEAEFNKVWTEYNRLLQLKSDADASAYAIKEFPTLSQETRERILGEMLTLAMEDKVAARDAMTEVGETVIEAFEALQKIDEAEKSE